MPGMMEDLSPCTTPALSVMQKLSACSCVRVQTPMPEITGTTLHCTRQPSRERSMCALVRISVHYVEAQFSKTVIDVFETVLVSCVISCSLTERCLKNLPTFVGD